MDKNKLKFWVDSLMFIDFIILAFSGFVLLISKKGIWLYKNLIFSRGQWAVIHEWASIILIILLLVHLILNWAWIKAMFKRALLKKTSEKN